MLRLSSAAALSPLFPACQSHEHLEPGRGRWLSRGNETLALDLSGVFQGRPFSLDSPFRVASISKILVAELARRLHRQGALDMDAEAGEIIDFPLRHPDFPAENISLRHLISHRSGIKDPAIYWMAAPGNIRSLLTDEIWEADARPGTAFRYSNLNYGLAATVMEAATQKRFDHLFQQQIAEPLGLDIGYNWSGVSSLKRRRGFPCLRGEHGQWEVQVDGAETLFSADPAILREPDFRLDDYVAGTNGTLFSPQGGLRASLQDLAVIGRDILLSQPDLWLPGWRAEDTSGKGSEEGHFVAFGEGIYIYPNGPLGDSEQAWVGHFGSAYGLEAGLWIRPHDSMLFIHADLGSPAEGSPMTGDDPNQPEIVREALTWMKDRDRLGDR